MIKIKIELHSAITGKVSQIGEMDIWNDATGDRDRGLGNYKYAWRRIGRKKGARTKLHTGMLQGFPRERKHVFDLLRECLNAKERPIVGECGHELYQDGNCHRTHILSNPPSGSAT